jgi:predicted TIM-barrel fold metal-dependent hydrolase
MRVDIHCHIGQHQRTCDDAERFSFEPRNVYAPYDAYFSERLAHGIGMRVGKRLAGIPANVEDADRRIESFLLKHILGSKELDRIVLLAMDQYHDDTGRPHGSRRTGSELGTDLYVSNTYIRSLWKKHPEKLLFGASVHPYRLGALDMLNEVAEARAVLIKWLPCAQNIDAADPRAVAFLRRAGELGMPLLIHYGGERALGNLHPDQEDPTNLFLALRQLKNEGCSLPVVVVAHVATPADWPFASDRYFRMLVKHLLGEFREEPLYADISGLTIFSRARWLKRIARRRDLHRKLVYGSDFPIPPTRWAFRRELGNKMQHVKGLESWIDRDLVIKEQLGIDQEVFSRGAKLLTDRIQAADRVIRTS